MLPSNNHASTLMDRVRAEFESRPFRPARLLTQADAQTLSAFFWPGRFRPRDHTGDQERLFQVDAESRVLGRCRWQAKRIESPTLVLWHGIESSSSAAYMLSTAAK